MVAIKGMVVSTADKKVSKEPKNRVNFLCQLSLFCQLCASTLSTLKKHKVDRKVDSLNPYKQRIKPYLSTLSTLNPIKIKNRELGSTCIAWAPNLINNTRTGRAHTTRAYAYARVHYRAEF